ncbi:MAG TPA: zinc ribbon domain-containing protein, partial [Nocardioides sp.]|nr:zinc ribbon domain-containing protein [Nocardioides sp.]
MTELPHDPAVAPELPMGARFDPVTGAELVGAGSGARRQSFALQPGEPVASFNLVSSLLPLAAGTAPQTYRWALGIGILIPVVAGALGFLAFAFVAAALVVPAVYVVYMYDVNQWEDQPLGVVVGAVGAAAALGVGFTFLWHAGLLRESLSPVDFEGNGSGFSWTTFLVLVLLVPIVSEVLKEVGPILLARRPAFDDMIDGLTFGVAAGAAFAAAETIVVNRGLFSSFGQMDSPNAGFWVSLILSAAVVKPIVYGAATGIAVASFSGLGAGYDGFKPAYFRGLAEALVANVLFQGGLYFTARVEGTTGAVLGLVWGALIAAALVVRLRYLLHYAVLEAALEASATGSSLKDTVHGTAYCPSCEMPLLVGANFCVACGTSVRAGNKVARARNRAEDTGYADETELAAPP